MRFWRPADLWLTGPVVFAPTLLLWVFQLQTWVFVRPRASWQFDTDAIRYTYLPMLAAVIGFGLPWFGLRLCGNTTFKKALAAVACYWLIMLGWGVIDIRHYNYQIGGHYSRAPEDGPGYFHAYFTWYFLPYYVIEP